MKAKDNNNKLPEVQKKGLMAKIKKAMFIVFASIGLTTVATGTANREVVEEQEYTTNTSKEKKDRFAESLKIIVDSEEINEKVDENINENMIDAVIEKRR